MFEALVKTMFQTNICRYRPYITFLIFPVYFSSYACKHFQSGNFLVTLLLEHFYELNGKSIGATLETYVRLELSNICLKHGIHLVFKS